MNTAIRILTVDDEPLITELVQMALALEGWQVDVAHNAAQALSRMEENVYQVVLTDFTLPGMTGDQLALRMRQKGFCGPILLMSGYPFHKRPPEICRVLPKPINLTELRFAVDEVVHGVAWKA